MLFCIVGFLTIISSVFVFFMKPASDAYSPDASEHILIVDPGHGGEDGGAVAADGTPEAELNLSIARKLVQLASFCGVQTVMTRSGGAIAYPPDAETIAARKTAEQKQRVALINSISNGVLISVHQNYYPIAGPHGAQVLYAPDLESETFGKAMQLKLVAMLDPENRRVASPVSEDIYLMRNVQCPAVLIECGFLSNQEELTKLKDSAYQLKLGLLMLSTYFEIYQTGWKQ